MTMLYECKEVCMLAYDHSMTLEEIRKQEEDKGAKKAVPGKKK